MGLEIRHGVRNASRGGHKRRGVCVTTLVGQRNSGGPYGYGRLGLPPRTIVWAFQS